MGYLAPPEYAAYGVPDAADAQVQSASVLFDSFVGRPEGLTWEPDFSGAPCYMTNLTPTLSYANLAIDAGTNVTVTVPGASFGNQNTGDVVILDRATQAEACVVTSAAGNTLALANVQNDHPAATLEFGLTLLDELPTRFRFSRWPVAKLFCAFGRYRYGREARRISSGFDEYETLLATDYGRNPVSGWSQLDTSLWDLNLNTGSVRMPRASHESIRVRYVAGWSKANLPYAVKQCVANITRNLIELGENGVPADAILLKAGDATIQRADSSLIDADTRALAQPYRVMRI